MASAGSMTRFSVLGAENALESEICLKIYELSLRDEIIQLKVFHVAKLQNFLGCYKKLVNLYFITLKE